VTKLIQEETGNKPKQSAGMRKECGIQGVEYLVDERNTSQGNRDINSAQNNTNRKGEERLNQTEDEASREKGNCNCNSNKDTSKSEIPSSGTVDGNENKATLPKQDKRCIKDKNEDFVLWF
jgi:TFIIF-interacting CTD phosphatase-like protein